MKTDKDQTINARSGLSIQIAYRFGFLPMLAGIDSRSLTGMLIEAKPEPMTGLAKVSLSVPKAMVVR